MSMIEVRPVHSLREKNTFLTFPWKIYKNDPLWVPPLLPERRKTLDTKRGAFFLRGGEAQPFMAWKDGKLAGTICAAEDKPVNAQRGLKDCMIGFFECIDDYTTAEALFMRAESWAKERHLNTLYGPFNLDYEDSYGVLVEGGDRPPALLCGHTPTYYLDFFQRFGFQPTRGDNIAFAIPADPSLAVVQRVDRLAQRVRRRGRVTVRGGDLEHWEDELERIFHLINIALAHLPDFIPWQREALKATFESLLPIVDPELILFAEVEGEVVGWFPGIRNLNEVFQHVNGLRYPWNYLTLLWRMRKPSKSLSIKSVLVHPDYWDTGVAVLLFDEMAKRAWAKGYTWADMSLTSEDNPDTPVLAERAGAQLYKRYRVFRYYIKD